jgi:hypothetical protein
MDENVILSRQVTELNIELDTTLVFAQGQAFLINELYDEVNILQGSVEIIVEENSICRREKFELENKVVKLKKQRNKARLIAVGEGLILALIIAAAIAL